MKGTGKCDPNGHLENKCFLAQSSRVQNTQKGGYIREGADSSPGKCLSLNKNPTYLLGDNGSAVRIVKIQILSPSPCPSRKWCPPAWNCCSAFFLSFTAFLFSPYHNFYLPLFKGQAPGCIQLGCLHGALYTTRDLADAQGMFDEWTNRQAVKGSCWEPTHHKAWRRKEIPSRPNTHTNQAPVGFLQDGNSSIHGLKLWVCCDRWRWPATAISPFGKKQRQAPGLNWSSHLLTHHTQLPQLPKSHRTRTLKKGCTRGRGPGQPTWNP